MFHRYFLVVVSARVEPQSFNEAMKDERWRQAMQAKIEALKSNRAWTLEPLPLDKKAIGYIFIYQ